MTRKLDHAVLEDFRKQMINLIKQRYKTIEEFCWETGLNKATLSNVINGRKDFSVSTLKKIADALGKKLEIRIR